MKSYLLTLSLSLFVLTSVTIAQNTETRNLDSFDGISVASGIKAELVKGNSNKIEITAEGVDLDKVTTKVSGDRLKVGFEKNNWKFWNNNKRKVSVTITYSDPLEYLSSSSGASVTADHTLTTNKIKLNTSSGANMNIELDASEVDIDVTSGAQMTVAGNSKMVNVDLSSGASLDASDLESASVTVDGSSGSSAKVHATSNLTVDVSSGAIVSYKGNPSKTDFDKSSGGSVRKI